MIAANDRNFPSLNLTTGPNLPDIDLEVGGWIFRACACFSLKKGGDMGKSGEWRRVAPLVLQ
jgi:hypothetical protein